MSLKIKFQVSYIKSFNCNSFIENSFLSCFLKKDHFPFWERVLIKTWQTSFENETTWLEQVSEVFPILHSFPSFIFLPNKRLKNINNVKVSGKCIAKINHSFKFERCNWLEYAHISFSNQKVSMLNHDMVLTSKHQHYTNHIQYK